MGDNVLLVEEQDGLSILTLNRPAVMNAFNVELLHALKKEVEAIRFKSDIRVVVITGAGEKAFSAGADLKEFLTAPSPVVARQIRFDRDVWGLFLSVPQPLIAALHGYVLGSGIEMALCCDLRIASDDARFGLPEVGLGIIPAAGGTQTLPRTVGRGYALEMLLTGRWIDAGKAWQIKLVNGVVPKKQLRKTVKEIAARIAAHDPDVMRCAKRAVVQGLDLPLAEGFDLERILASRFGPGSISKKA